MQVHEPRRWPSVWTVLAVLVVIHLLVPLLEMAVPVLVVIAALLGIYKMMFHKRI